MSRHFTSDELLAYVDKNDAVVNLADVERHLERCLACRKRLDEATADVDLITDLLRWRDRMQPPRPPTRDRFTEFATARERIEREAARAEVVVAMLANDPPRAWAAFLDASAADATEGLVRRITALARDEEERDARRAATLLDIAEAVATRARLDPRRSSEALGDLWKERANACMIRGDFARASDAIDRAEALYGASPVAAFHLAFTTWLRATLYFETGRFAEALPFAERAAAIFREFGDEVREIHVRVLVACLLYEEGRVADAEARFIALLLPVQRLRDRMTEARLLANLACCALFRDDLTQTNAYAQRAITIYDDFARETEIIRMRWALAVVYLRRGESERGIAALHEIAAAFEGRGLTAAAAEAELQIAEEHLRRREYAAAAVIAGRLATTFANMDAHVSAAKAFAYLYDASRNGRATSALVRAARHVLAYPEQPFTPPENAAVH
jgi:tetratricopeptide (TPR) repeat protein